MANDGAIAVPAAKLDSGAAFESRAANLNRAVAGYAFSQGPLSLFEQQRAERMAATQAWLRTLPPLDDEQDDGAADQEDLAEERAQYRREMGKE